jgi:hypothetical protein
MRVVLKPVNGTAESNLGRAREEVIRVLSFRGDVTGAKTEGSKIAVEFEINPKWDLPSEQKVGYLKEWISAKVRSIFEVLSVSE